MQNTQLFLVYFKTSVKQKKLSKLLGSLQGFLRVWAGYSKGMRLCKEKSYWLPQTPFLVEKKADQV